MIDFVEVKSDIWVKYLIAISVRGGHELRAAFTDKEITAWGGMGFIKLNRGSKYFSVPLKSMPRSP